MPSSLDPRIWKAIAGAGKIPTAGSLVYYFPQGHAEQASSPPNFASFSSTARPFALCRVAAVRLLANPDTDEVFASIRLVPVPSFATAAVSLAQPQASFNPGSGIGQEDAVSFAKILTPSDANNGGGFSVPRFCADSVFPELDFRADPPVQNILVNDVHGTSWEFRHIYRGTPRRHLLTTGWSRFVNSKRLIAGDSVVFIKNGDGELFVGIRRTGRSCGNPDYMKLDEGSLNGGSKDGFSRNVKGRVPAESIVEAVRSMELGCEFEVLYYPRAGSAEFVVEKEVVDRSLGLYWGEGMRVKMSVETDDSSRMTWFQGTVRHTDVKDSGLWANSPWRMLQVTWDEPEVLQNVRAVSPWQVEFVPTSPHMQTSFPAMKKLKIPPCLELPSEGHGNLLFHQSLTNNVKMGDLTPLFNYSTFPAGMQGARHDLRVPNLSAFVHGNTHNMFISDNQYDINMHEELNSSQSEAASPPSQENIHNHNLKLLGVATFKPTRKVSKGSFQLFGQIIHMDQPDDVGAHGKYAEDEAVRSLEFSLAFPYNHMLDGVDGRISAVEACPI